jgi:transposase-like protein
MRSVARDIRHSNAIEELAAGASVSEAARRLGVSRRTIERWIREPEFLARLNRRRREVWTSAHDRSRRLVHQALAVFETELEAGNLEAARDILRQFGPSLAAGAASIGSDDPVQIKREEAVIRGLGDLQEDLLAGLGRDKETTKEVT